MYVCSRAAVAREWLRRNVSAVFREGASSEPFVAVEARRPWDPTDPCWSEWRPDRCPTLRWICPGSVRRLVWAFTDGSTGERRGLPSRCGVVLTEWGVVAHEFGFRAGPRAATTWRRLLPFWRPFCLSRRSLT